MRSIVAAMICLGGLCRADPAPETQLKDFAHDYAEAVKVRDVSKIETFWLPALLKPGTPAQNAVVAGWLQGLRQGILPASDPVWINVKRFGPNPQIMASGKWLAQPEYQIEMQSHHSANGGEAGGPELAEAVCSQSGTFYIVRPLPK
jgi:hypothetical protein